MDSDDILIEGILPEPPKNPLYDLMRELRSYAEHEGWDSRLEEPLFVEQAGRVYKAYLNANRILTHASRCKDCLEHDNEYLNKPECSIYRHSVDVAQSLEQQTVVAKMVLCPLVAEERVQQYREQLLENFGLGRDEIDKINMSGMTPPTISTHLFVFNQVKKRCQAYADDPKGQSLYIFSPTNGNGKTRFAVGTALRYMLKNSKPARYINASVFFSLYKDKLGQRDGDASFEAFTLLRPVAEFDGLLVIDDYGKEVKSERFEQMMYDIVYTRDMYNLPTVFTSNMPLRGANSLQEHLMGDRGKAIISRIIGKTQNDGILDMSILPDYRSRDLDATGERFITTFVERGK